MVTRSEVSPGWETNLDNKLIASKEIYGEVVLALRDQLDEELVKSKYQNYKELKKIVSKALNGDSSALNNLTIDDLLKLRSDLISALNGNKQMGALEFDPKDQKLQIIFQDKLNLLSQLKDGNVDMAYQGKAHRGFTLKVASAMAEINYIIERDSKSDYVDNYETARTARLMTTGHSMGGALSKIFAASIARSWSKRMLPEQPVSEVDGPSAVRNAILVHALSAAPIGDQFFKDTMESAIGVYNIIDQKVETDPVPMVLPTYYGKGGYVDQIGTPLIDYLLDVKERAYRMGYLRGSYYYTGLTPVEYLALSHYGASADITLPENERFGRAGAVFQYLLALPILPKNTGLNKKLLLVPRIRINNIDMRSRIKQLYQREDESDRDFIRYIFSQEDEPVNYEDGVKDLIEGYNVLLRQGMRW